MSDFLKNKKMLRLLLEGFAKRGVFDKRKIDIVKMGDLIERRFYELTDDVEPRLQKEMLLVLIMYMIWRLGKPLDPNRREELVKKYGTDRLKDYRESFEYKEEDEDEEEIYTVYGDIPDVAHEIIHEIMHAGSVEYFERQNSQTSRDLSVEYIYDFLESIALTFDFGVNWKKSDKHLWEEFKELLKEYFRGWLNKNRFFAENNFNVAYSRFKRAFMILNLHAKENMIFERFWKFYMKPHMYDIVLKDKSFKDGVEKAFRFNKKVKNGNETHDSKKQDEVAEAKVLQGIYDYIEAELFKNLDKVFKDRFVLTVDILSKIGQALYELHNINLRKDKIIRIIRKWVLKRAGLWKRRGKS